ncbi:MAG: carbohydrate ABC transporter permease [Caldilineaceae bacterium]|nr:carbohydrate ABC transporter permease [Caldilineaceae bacterium]
MAGASLSQTSTRSRIRYRKTLSQVMTYLLLAALSVVFAMPMIWLISTSLKPDAQMAEWPPVWIPSPLQWDHFWLAWSSGNFGLYFINTATITITATLGQVLTASMAAYGFTRLRFPGRNVLFGVLLATMMLPGVVTLIPTFILFKELGWLDSFKPLIVPAYFGGGAFFIFLLRQFFRTLPPEIFEQATIDGASSYRIYAQIVLPLAKPALATVAIFGFMNHWNDLMAPLIYINSPDKFTLTLGLRRFMGLVDVRYQEMMAMALLMTLPVLLVFFFFQQYFIEGVVMSGLKG